MRSTANTAATFIIPVGQIVCGCTYSIVCDRGREKSTVWGWFVYCLSGSSFMFWMHHQLIAEENLRLDEPERTFRGVVGCVGVGDRGAQGEGAVREPHFCSPSPVWTSLPLFHQTTRNSVIPSWMLLQLLVPEVWWKIFVLAVTWCNPCTSRGVNNSPFIVAISH